MRTQCNDESTSKTEAYTANALFGCVFLYWLTLGVLTLLFRETNAFFEIAGFYIDYGSHYIITGYYLAFYGSFLLTKKLTSGYPDKSTINIGIASNSLAWILLSAAISLVLFRLSSTGLTLVSGDYSSRFLDDSNLLVKVLPTALALVALQLFWAELVFSPKNGATKPVLAIILFAVLSTVTASRSAAFYVALSLGYCLVTYLTLRSTQWNRIYIYLTLIIALTGYYFLGQIVNVWRWFAMDGTFDDMIFAIVGDSFPEYRTHALAFLQQTSLHLVDRLSVMDWLRNLLPYFLPGFVYDVIGLSRQNEFNWLWKTHFEYLFWMGNTAEYGLRTGLVGELSLTMGYAGCVIGGAIFALLIKISRTRVLTATCLCATVPYGATAVYLYAYCLFIYYLGTFLLKQGVQKSTRHLPP